MWRTRCPVEVKYGQTIGIFNQIMSNVWPLCQPLHCILYHDTNVRNNHERKIKYDWPKLQKRICRTFGPSFAASLEPLVCCQNIASSSLFYRYYFGRCLFELAQLVPLPFFQGKSTRYSDRLLDFSLIIPRCYKNVYANSFFPRTATLWSSLSIECFLLTYDLNDFKSRINRHLLTVGSF